MRGAARGGPGSGRLSPVNPERPPREPAHPDLSGSQKSEVVLACIFPSQVFALAPERVFYMCLSPVDVDHVQTRWGVGTWGPLPKDPPLEEIDRLYHEVNGEDRMRLESIQRTVRSRFSPRGHFLTWSNRTGSSTATSRGDWCPMAKRYDVIIVGGGHNGLTCAAYLARAGVDVLVLERRHIVGGPCAEYEYFPGFRLRSPTLPARWSPRWSPISSWSDLDSPSRNPTRR